jgi:hypothetical protein
LTSLTQIESHVVLQQYGSWVQIEVTHELQPLASLLPVEQSEWEQLPPPPHELPQIELTSPTQIESHADEQQ